MKLGKAKIIIGAIIIACGWFCMIMTITGKVSLSVSGFAIDNSGRLYIGQGHGIDVYDDDVIVETISPKTSRGYAFTIVNGDTIVVSTGSFVYHMDLNGEVLSRYEDELSRVYGELEDKTLFVDENGVNYKLTKPFGRTQISNGEKVIYKMPLIDYAVLVLTALCFTALFVFVIILLKDKVKAQIKGIREKNQVDG